MCKRIIILFIVMYPFFELFSQNQVRISLQDIQGIWWAIYRPDNTNNSQFLQINKGFKSLGFGWELNDERNFISENYIGFQDSSAYDMDKIKISKLKESGDFYTEISKSTIDKDGFATVPDFSTPEIIELTESSLWINYGNISMFEKIKCLPILALTKLYYRGKSDNRDYIKEYLNIQAVEIMSKKCTIYSEPNKSTKKQLNKGDIVTILEEKGNWLKVNYGEDNIGWIKKKDIK